MINNCITKNTFEETDMDILGTTTTKKKSRLSGKFFLDPRKHFYNFQTNFGNNMLYS